MIDNKFRSNLIDKIYQCVQDEKNKSISIKTNNDYFFKYENRIKKLIEVSELLTFKDKNLEYEILKVFILKNLENFSRLNINISYRYLNDSDIFFNLKSSNWVESDHINNIEKNIDEYIENFIVMDIMKIIELIYKTKKTFIKNHYQIEIKE